MWSAGLVPCTLVVALLALSALPFGGYRRAPLPRPKAKGRSPCTTARSREAWYAYTRRCGVRVWGEDELGPRVVLHPGQSAAWPETAGCYDLLVLTNPRIEPRFEARYERRQVVADQQTTIAIADADWGPSAAAPAVTRLRCRSRAPQPPFPPPWRPMVRKDRRALLRGPAPAAR